MGRRRLYFFLLLFWVGLTFLFTSIPNLKVPEYIPFWDKGAHFVFYGVTGFLCSLWRRESGFPAKRAVLYAVLFVLAVGAVDEVHQHWIPGRSMALLDWVADILGGGTGAVFSLLLPRLFPFLVTE
ncbi:MAG: VanZ family protein [Candidatus Deferrimicrobiaceae bacterium]